jgi:hypothetical protein
MCDGYYSPMKFCKGVVDVVEPTHENARYIQDIILK